MKKILSNLITTTSLNAFTYLIPLVITPYFLRVAGTENFALLNIAQSIVQYFILFVGFNLDGIIAGEIAVIKNNPIKLSNIFWQTTYARLLLFLIATIIFILVLFFFLINGKNVLLLCITYFGLFGYAITPLWYYQGTEKFTQLFLFNAISKIIFAIVVFTCVTRSQDFWYYSLGLSISQIISGLLLFLYPIYKFKLSHPVISLKETYLFLKQKFYLFKGGTMVNFCMNINVSLLGIILSLQQFGLYMAAYKLVLVIFTVVTLPLNQSLYPYISRTISENKEEAIRKIREILVPSVVYISVGLCVVLFVFSKFLIQIMLGPQFLESETAFKIMTFSLVANVLTNVVALQLFIKLNFLKAYSGITQTSAVLSVFFTIAFSFFFNVSGAAVAWLISEFFILGYSTYKLNKERILVFNRQSLHPKPIVAFWIKNKLSFLIK